MNKAGKLLCAAVFGCGLAMTAMPGHATELWDPHLRAVDSGLAAGALPPKGLYFVMNNYWGAFKDYTSNHDNGNRLNVLVEAPILLWNPGIKLLGADYSAAIAQPFDYTDFGTPGSSNPGHWGTFNTLLMPVMMSWGLPYHFHVKGSFGVWLDDASSSPSASAQPSHGTLGAGNAFTTFEPGLGVSWLNDGWNASAQMYYDTSTADNNHLYADGSTGTYQSGDQIAVDYTLTKTIKKWTVGLNGFQLNQLQRDQEKGVATAGTVAMSWGVGPTVGYQFGGINLALNYTHDVVVHNDVGGDIFNLRAIVPLF